MKKTIYRILIIYLMTLISSCDQIGIKYYYKLGYSSHQAGDFEEAIKNYKRVVQLDSSYVNAYISMGSAYLDLGLFTKSLESYENALKLTPNNAIIYAYVGRVYFDKKDNLTALDYIEKAIKMDQNLGYAYYNRGLIKYTTFSYAEGCVDLKKSLTLGYEKAQDLLNEAYCEDYE